MAPSLTVAADTTVVRARRLPVPGEVRVHPGEVVAPTDVVAEAEVPGPVLPLPLAGLLGCDAADVVRFLEVRPGQPVRRGARLARAPGLWGIGRREVVAPVDGVVLEVSPRSGQLLLRGRSSPVRLLAHLPGTVVRVWPGQGCALSCHGALVQGVYGVGGEVRGTLRWMQVGEGTAEAPAAPDLAGVVCAASVASAACVMAWAASGAVAAVLGGMGYEELAGLRRRLPNFSVVLTEGFGALPMQPRTRRLLVGCDGALACVDGTTRIRAGVVRPEVFVPAPPLAADPAPRPAGVRVRIVRAPHAGQSGTVIERPVQPRRVENGALLPVVLVRLDGDGPVWVPQANVEPEGPP
jgi:hypothetical protein